MARNCVASIDLNAIKKNYLYAKSLAPKSNAIAVIKGNAYGHGAIKVASHLETSADCFGVACIEEALDLTNAGILTVPILLLEGVFEESELSLVDRNSFWMVVCNTAQIEWILKSKPTNKYDIFVKIDTGMGRLGFQEEDSIKVISDLEKSNNVRKITLMTHFSSADNQESDSTKTQINKFNEIIETKQNNQSLSNSAAIMSFTETHREFTRPGIMLYGSSPFSFDEKPNELIPAMTLETSLISLKKFKSGDTIGYGQRYVCKKDTLIGVAAIGYADGYPRSAKDGTPVYINGGIARLAGRVSMDMITVDLTGIKSPQIGDRVELFGSNVSIDEVAQYCNTISYEIFSQITSRVYKTYVP